MGRKEDKAKLFCLMALKPWKSRLRFFFVSVLQDPASWVNIHHLEYMDGGILDPDDVLADVVEDKDKVELGWKYFFYLLLCLFE